MDNGQYFITQRGTNTSQGLSLHDGHELAKVVLHMRPLPPILKMNITPEILKRSVRLR